MHNMVQHADDGSPASAPAPDVVSTQLTRRDLIGVAAGMAVSGCAGKAPRWELQEVASKQGVVEVDIAAYPELATPGGMVALKPKQARKPILVMRIENDQFRVLSLRCPHLGCVVRWDDAVQDLQCPCHGSRFDERGERTAGPAKRGLTPLRNAFLGMQNSGGNTLLRILLDEA